MNATIISLDAMAVLSKENENYIEVWLRVWENRKSLVGIVVRAGLGDTWFYLLHNVLTCSGVHPAFC
jgi:hypothetical protein